MKKRFHRSTREDHLTDELLVEFGDSISIVECLRRFSLGEPINTPIFDDYDEGDTEVPDPLNTFEIGLENHELLREYQEFLHNRRSSEVSLSNESDDGSSSAAEDGGNGSTKNDPPPPDQGGSE